MTKMVRYSAATTMIAMLTRLGERTRVLCTKGLQRLGLREDSFFIVPAVLIGIITAAAAVGFHQLIQAIKYGLYGLLDPNFLYGWGLPLLVLFPAAGGLVVGIISIYIAKAREGHGIVDVIESVVRANGFIRPASAIEKIVTSAVTIGTGGSTGTEGPIVQIGAAIASGVGLLFRFARHQMPIVIGCGSAAGISAIFNAPIGGVIFTLEVILQDFSIRTFTPLVVASVIGNVTTRAIFARYSSEAYAAIFAMPAQSPSSVADNISLSLVPTFAFLGLICGVIGVSLTKLMAFFEEKFLKFKWMGAFRPAFGGALLGLMGIAYVLIFGRVMMGQHKPFPFQQYPMPAFFADGYGVIQTLLAEPFYLQPTGQILILLASLCVLKLFATCVTLGSGGSGGVIAPSLMLGATTGGLIGLILRESGWFASLHPQTYALVGMAAVLAAVVHAPLSSIFILLELTQDYKVMLPAMIATVFATGVARLIFVDSIYTHSLRMRGIRSGSSADLSLLRRMKVEQVPLSPATMMLSTDPAQRIFDLISQFGSVDLVITDNKGCYKGMVVSEDINIAILSPEALPLMVVEEFVRSDVPTVKTSDDLATALDLFSRYDISHLPVSLSQQPLNVIGLLSRNSLMRVYHEGLSQ